MEASAPEHAPSTVDDSSPERDPRLDDLISRLGDRVAPITLARRRLLAVSEPLDELFVEGGIIRGQVLSCQGAASSSLALALVGRAMSEGSWLAVVDVDSFGVDAADELGLPLERVVRIDTAHTVDTAGTDTDGVDAEAERRRLDDWVEVLGATIDGFDLVIARVPTSGGATTPAPVRKLTTRLRRRGAVVVLLGDPGVVPVDLTVSSTRSVWSGLGAGSGLLRRRRVEVEAVGRRQPGARRCTVDFVGGRHGVDLAATRPETVESTGVPGGVPDDPQEQVLREMCAELDARQGDRDRDPLEHRVAG